MNDTPLRRGPLAAALACLSASTALAVEVEYQYYRFTPRKVAGVTNLVQVSEFQFLNGGTPVSTAGVIATNPGGTNAPDAAEGAEKLIDGDTATKWLDGTISPVIFEFPAPTAIDGYNLATANDAAPRDPVSWSLYGSNDGADWVLLDTVKDTPPVTARFTYLPGFDLPDGPPPAVWRFQPLPLSGQFAPPRVVVDGTSVDLEWFAEPADASFTLEGQTVTGEGPTELSEPVEAEDLAVVVPLFGTDTTYTLRGENASGTDESELTIRSVAGGDSTFRYIRFTPVKLRDNAAANSIQVSEFVFLDGFDIVTVDGGVTNPGGANPGNGNEGPEKVIDGQTGTKWLDFNKRGLVFDFGEPKTFDHYGFATANDAIARDPVRWILEGRDSPEEPWTLIDNLTDFDFPVPTARQNYTQDIPLPGASLPPYVTLVADAAAVPEGEPVTLTFSSSGAASLSADNEIGDLPLSGTIKVIPDGPTTYTFTATGENGKTGVSSVTVGIVTPPPTSDSIAYANFNIVGTELLRLGATTIVTDPTRPQPGAQGRLRITGDIASQTGAAWFRYRQDVGAGFETTFDLHVTSLNSPGADGVAFVIQNRPEGIAAFPTVTQENGLSSEALNVKFDSYLNEGDPSAGFIEVRAGAEVLATANLVGAEGITLRGDPLTLTDGTAQGTPYAIRIAYVPGDLDIWFDGVLVVDSLAVDLGAIGAVDEDGEAYVGFTGRTGGQFAAHDITSWFLTEGAPAGGGGELMLTDWSFDFASDQLTLTWASEAGKTYRVTTSDTFSSWAPVQSGIPSGGASTSVAVGFTQGTRAFFRVEEE